MAWTEAKFDRSTRENYETLHFVTAIGEVEGKTLFVSGRCVGRVTYSNIPCDAQLYHEVHGGGFFTSQTTQVIVAFRRGDEHMQQSPQGDLFSAPPEPLAERYELDEAWQTTAFSIAYGVEAAADRVGEDTEAEHSAALAWDEDSLMTSCPRRCCLEEAPLAAPLHLLRGMPAAINGRSVDFPGLPAPCEPVHLAVPARLRPHPTEPTASTPTASTSSGLSRPHTRHRPVPPCKPAPSPPRS